MNWVLCRVFLKKRSNNNKKKKKEDQREKKEEIESDDNKSTCPIFYDFMRNDVKKGKCCTLNLTRCSSPSSASSSVCSSALIQTCLNSDSDNHHQETSCRGNKFHLFL